MSTESSVVNANIPTEEQAKIEYENKKKYALERLRELRNLWIYLENKNSSNRQQRKQFRRDFIANDNFGINVIDNVIEFYETGVNS